MLLNNNKPKVEVQSTAARLARIPLVRSTVDRLSVLYTDTKSFHPGLASMCHVLESSVTTVYVTVSPVIDKLEPHISIANAVACKSLDWLEASFPVLLSPTDQIVASAKNKWHGIQDAVQHKVMCVMTGTHQGHDGVNLALLQRAITLADAGLDSALSCSETLLEKFLPPEEDEGLDETSLEGFDVAKVPKCYPERVASLVVKFCRRTYCIVGSRVQSAQLSGGLSSPSALMQYPQTSGFVLIWKLQALPEYLQRQALSVMCFVFHVYHLIFSSQQVQSNARHHLKAQAPSPQSDMVRGSGLPPSTRRMRHTRLSMFDNGSNFEGHLHR